MKRKLNWLNSAALAAAFLTLALSEARAQPAEVWVLKFEFTTPRPIIMRGDKGKEVYWYFTYQVTNLDKSGTKELALLNARTVAQKKLLDEEKIDLAIFRTAREQVEAEKAKVREKYAHRFVPDIRITTETNKSYREGFFPRVKRAIEKKRGLKLLDSIRIIGKIPLGESREGVVIFKDIDPAADHLFVFVKGLTNAYRVSGPPDKQRVEWQVLIIECYRPGDYADPLMEKPILLGKKWDWR